MKLSELKNESLVKLRNGNIFLVLKDTINRDAQFLHKTDFLEDMTAPVSDYLDIVEVREGEVKWLDSLINAFENGTVVWVRNEEFESELKKAKELKKGDPVIVWNVRGTEEFIRVFKEYLVKNETIEYVTYDTTSYRNQLWKNCRKADVNR